MLRAAVIGAIVLMASTAFGQRRVVDCPTGKCPLVAAPPATVSSGAAVTIATLNTEDSKDLSSSNQIRSEVASAGGGDPFEQVIRATVRVTVSGVCGSGTVVGRDKSGRALILTNAHVAGTTKGRTVNVERWETNGRSEKSTASIIASGYGRGMSLDFAVLRAADGFAGDVKPVPMANRQPDTSTLITTYGCPRCEWPSLQVLRLNRSEGQILTWHPEAIGGRSGSSVIDYTANGPEVVGLLTWGGGGEGLGQSMPFVLNALQGRLPKALESLPPYAKEVSDSAETRFVRTAWPTQDIEPGDEDLLENVTGGKLGRKPPKENPPAEPDTGILNRNPDRPVVQWMGSMFLFALAFGFGLFNGAILGFVFKERISKWFS
ncbi:hypothetical protein VN12_16630 [Pirellula sp. SH-Sr6A]|uniref:trypsin-like peptidase domain-containing protein n=1 Tax=Pirellula sp. SH-Sr6A TaxID=1632865 RepID=UPI00078BFDDC|nr:trypsin-like peptidase domain-containing protein [Pirellula sp. SH-Sr6A]AMV33757.1 hypothetical protein VN12_16630 [Pirellula sp. SH-Sr6A]